MSNEKCCGFIVYKLDDDGQKYLLLYQRETGTWSFPKGHMNPGETEMQTALRELYEETGLVADPVCGFRKEYSYTSGNGNKKDVVLFLTEYWGDDIMIGDDIAVYEWVDAGEVVERMAGRNILPVISAADHYAVSVFLRDLLNGVPCTSGNEFTTKEFLMAFLGNCGELAIQDMDNWFYAVHYEDDNLPWVAVRADMDAILDSEGHPFHGCGHDGHSAVVACLAVLQSSLTLNKNIVYIFQPEEETGAGAEKCLPILPFTNILLPVIFLCFVSHLPLPIPLLFFHSPQIPLEIHIKSAAEFLHFHIPKLPQSEAPFCCDPEVFQAAQ